MFARLFLAGIVAALLAAPAQAQGWRKALMEIGRTAAAREVAVDVARRSDVVRKIMEGVGFQVESEAAAVRQWRSLSTEQLGAIITRDDRLTSRFLGSQRLNTEDRELWFSGINKIRRQNFDVPALGSESSSSAADGGNPVVVCDAGCRSLLRYGGGGAAASSAVPLSDYIDRLIKKNNE